MAGILVNFTDGGKGGTFSKTFVRTDSTGIARTNYTLPTKSGIFTITASSPNFEGVAFAVTAIPGTATTLVPRSGAGQSAPVTNALPLPVVAKALDIYGNPVAGVTVNFADRAMGGTFSPASVGTNSSGWASSSYTTSTKAGTVTLKGMSTGLATVSFPETVTAGPVFTIALAAGNNQTTQPGTQLSQALAVTLTDQYGNLVPGSPVTFSDNGAGGSFSANPVTSDSHGQATVNYTASTKAGNVSITGSDGGVSSPSFTATVSAAPFSALTLTSGGNQTAQAGTQLSLALVVTCADQYGNPISGTSVTFSDSAAGGSFSANPVTSDSNGRATVSYTAPTKAGNVSVTGSASGVSSPSFHETVTAGPVSTLTLTSGNSQTAQAGTQFSQPLAVTLADQYGNLVPGSAVTFSDNNAGGSFSANPVASDSHGQATVSYTAPLKAGAVAVKAAATGVSSGSFSETVIAASASALNIIAGNNQSGAAGYTLATQLVVQVTDGYGNSVSGTPVTFSDFGAGGSFFPNPMIGSDTNGLASVAYTVPTATGSVTVTAVAPGLSSVSFNEAAVAGSAAALNQISGDGQTATAGSTLPLPLVVEVTDQYGNPVSGVAVTFDDGGVGGAFSGNPIVTDASGSASVVYTTPQVSQSISITASIPSGMSVVFSETAQ